MRYLVVVWTILLAGCGQAGDLYLPPEPAGPPSTAPYEAPPATPAQVPEEKKDKP